MSTKPVAAPAVDQDKAPPAASPEERIDFLKQSIEFTEGSIRAYDTKSQIALAAFVLSMSQRARTATIRYSPAAATRRR